MEALLFKIFDQGTLAVPVTSLSSIVDETVQRGATVKPAMLPPQLAFWLQYRGEIVPVLKPSVLDSAQAELPSKLLLILENFDTRKKVGLPCNAVFDIVSIPIDSCKKTNSGTFATNPADPSILVQLISVSDLTAKV